ncbi:hypothetical protein RRG08_038479 [Elysia crispata]|uniref:Uncharacterized protein n=1 Tax=Elysia crispata TaxID=231223 RepID=A0AAE1CKV9_9GAST|nr:hypothetical protein RRG08_038479 [Elysia crispata]
MGNDSVSPKKRKTIKSSALLKGDISSVKRNGRRRLKNKMKEDMISVNISANSSYKLDGGSLNNDSVVRSKKPRELGMVRSDIGFRNRSQELAGLDESREEHRAHNSQDEASKGTGLGQTTRHKTSVHRDLKAMQSLELVKQRIPVARRRSHEISSGTRTGHKSSGHFTNKVTGTSKKERAAGIDGNESYLSSGSSDIKTSEVKSEGSEMMSNVTNTKRGSKKKKPGKISVENQEGKQSIVVSSSSSANESMMSNGISEKMNLLTEDELQASLAESKSQKGVQDVANTCISDGEGSKSLILPEVEHEVESVALLRSPQVLESKGGSVDSVAVVETMGVYDAGSEGTTVVGISDCTYTPGSGATESESKCSDNDPNASSDRPHKEFKTSGTSDPMTVLTDSGPCFGVKREVLGFARNSLKSSMKEANKERFETSPVYHMPDTNDTVQVNTDHIDLPEMNPCEFKGKLDVEVTDESKCYASVTVAPLPQFVSLQDPLFSHSNQISGIIEAHNEEVQDHSAAFEYSSELGSQKVDAYCQETSVFSSELNPCMSIGGGYCDASGVPINFDEYKEKGPHIKTEGSDLYDEHEVVVEELAEPESSDEDQKSCLLPAERDDRDGDSATMEKLIIEQNLESEKVQEEIFSENRRGFLCPQLSQQSGIIKAEYPYQAIETSGEEILLSNWNENDHRKDLAMATQDSADDSSFVEQNEDSVLGDLGQGYRWEDPADSMVLLMKQVGMESLDSPVEHHSLEQQGANEGSEDSSKLSTDSASFKSYLTCIHKIVPDDTDNSLHSDALPVNTADSSQKLKRQLKNILNIWRRKVFRSKWPVANHCTILEPGPCLFPSLAVSKCNKDSPAPSSQMPSFYKLSNTNRANKTEASSEFVSCDKAANVSTDVDTGLADKIGDLGGSIVDQPMLLERQESLKVPDHFYEAHIQDVLALQVDFQSNSGELSISSKSDGNIFLRGIQDGLGDNPAIMTCDSDESADASEQTSASSKITESRWKGTAAVKAENMLSCSVEPENRACNTASSFGKVIVTRLAAAETQIMSPNDNHEFSSQQDKSLGELAGNKVAQTKETSGIAKNPGLDSSYMDEKIVCTITSDKPLNNRVFITCSSPEPVEGGHSGNSPELLVRVRLAGRASTSPHPHLAMSQSQSVPYVETHTVDTECLQTGSENGSGTDQHPSTCVESDVDAVENIALGFTIPDCAALSVVLEPIGDLLVIFFWVCLATTVILYELALYPLE